MTMRAHNTDTQINPAVLLPDVLSIARAAGNILHKHWHDTAPIEIIIKEDGSPVTVADKQSSDLITQRLTELTPNITVMCEENDQIPDPKKSYWAIDPLDGTKIFIDKGTGFATNIALIVDGDPVLGVVNCPAHNTMYFTTTGMPSYKQTDGEEKKIIKTKQHKEGTALTTAFDSAHGDIATYGIAQKTLAKEFNLYLPNVPMTERAHPFNMLVAEGIIDINVKTGSDPTLHRSGGFAWDNAADQLILRNAGGGIVDLYNHYNSLNYSTIGRGRMHAYMALGDRRFRDNVFSNHPH